VGIIVKCAMGRRSVVDTRYSGINPCCHNIS